MSLSKLLNKYEQEKAFPIEFENGFVLMFKPLPSHKAKKIHYRCTDKDGRINLAMLAEELGNNIVGWKGLTYKIFQSWQPDLDIDGHSPDEEIPFSKEDALRLVQTYRWASEAIIGANEKIYPEQKVKEEKAAANFLDTSDKN